jgi:hypothetical protein
MGEIASNDAAIGDSEGNGLFSGPVESAALGVNLKMIPDNMFT